MKRCVGGPGQTLQIKNNVIYLDGKAQKQPKDVQFNYLVHFNQPLPTDFCKENGITAEDIERNESGTVTMPLTEDLRRKLERMPEFCSKPVKAPSFNQWLFPPQPGEEMDGIGLRPAVDSETRRHGTAHLGQLADV